MAVKALPACMDRETANGSPICLIKAERLNEDKGQGFF
jgi:hypothetical protein